MLKCAALVFAMALSFPTSSQAQYVFSNGTIWDEGTGFILDTDPSEFKDLRYVGRATKQMYDRRVRKWISTKAFVFRARFEQGRNIEVHVHADFATPESAQVEVLRYTHPLGQLPLVMRRGIKTFSVLPGNALYGGGNDNVHVSATRTNEYLGHGNLAEVLFHEAAHASLDPRYGKSAAWRKAQRADSEFISKYAFDHPGREDMAEMSLVAYAILRHPNRVPRAMRERVERTMPNRMEFFRKLFDR